MGLQINISPEDIDDLVRNSIIQSGFGKAIEGIIKDAIGYTGYNSPIKREMEKYIGELASALIRDKYKDKVSAAVAKVIEETVTDDVINKTVSEATKRIVRAAEDY